MAKQSKVTDRIGRKGRRKHGDSMHWEEIGHYVPVDWLSRHWDEFMELSEKITKTIIIAQAVEKKWKHSMRTREDYEKFMQVEAKSKNMTLEKVRRYLVEAGRLKARNFIFERHCVPLLPKDAQGRCAATRTSLLQFVNRSIEEANIQF